MKLPTCNSLFDIFAPPAPQAGFVRRPMANDLLFSGMKKAGKKILRLLMLLWKNYGAGKPAAI
ncbi:MAG: hypothetical protein ACP5D1_11260, partial [Bacteroidales bacterium]